MWPRREREDKHNPMLAPTRPLDPKTLEILEKRIQQKSQAAAAESNANPAADEEQGDASTNDPDSTSPPE
jgi:hypothetical protein